MRRRTDYEVESVYIFTAPVHVAVVVISGLQCGNLMGMNDRIAAPHLCLKSGRVEVGGFSRSEKNDAPTTTTTRTYYVQAVLLTNPTKRQKFTKRYNLN